MIARRVCVLATRRHALRYRLLVGVGGKTNEVTEGLDILE